jgi:hypothetical protein
VGSSVGNVGASAYAALVEWENYGRLAALAPGLADRIAVAEASAGALARYRAALDRLIAADQDPAAGMADSVRFVDAARARVAPSDWWEALAKWPYHWQPLVDVQRPVRRALDHNTPATGTAERLAAARGGSRPDRLTLGERRLAGEALGLRRLGALS